MSTLAQYRRAMHTRSRHQTGRTEAIASLTTTTAVVTALATGTVTAGKYGGKWMLRAETATAADRVRLSTETGFASATGTLTHAGAVYADTTATSEFIELCEYEPYLYDDAIQTTLQSLNREDRLEFPTRNGVTHYWLNDASWVTEPRDVLKVTLKTSPVLSRNRYFEQWNSVNASGIPVPDWWVISGAAATVARSTAQVRTGQYSAAITRSGTDALLTQTVGLLDTGIIATGGSGSLIAQSVQVVLVGNSAVASQLRGWMSFDGGVTKTYTTAYHTGGSGFEELLSVNTTIPATATNVSFGVSVEGSNTVCYGDDCYLVFSGVNDSVRRDEYPEEDITDRISYDQGAGTLRMNTPPYGWGSQLCVYSMRPYSGFDATRLAAGSADADVQDAPLVTVALGALWRLYDSVPLTPEHAAAAAHWRQEYEALAAPHLEDETEGRDGLPLPTMQMAGGRRF